MKEKEKAPNDLKLNQDLGHWHTGSPIRDASARWTKIDKDLSLHYNSSAVYILAHCKYLGQKLISREIASRFFPDFTTQNISHLSTAAPRPLGRCSSAAYISAHCKNLSQKLISRVIATRFFPEFSTQNISAPFYSSTSVISTSVRRYLDPNQSNSGNNLHGHIVPLPITTSPLIVIAVVTIKLHQYLRLNNHLVPENQYPSSSKASVAIIWRLCGHAGIMIIVKTVSHNLQHVQHEAWEPTAREPPNTNWYVKSYKSDYVYERHKGSTFARHSSINRCSVPQTPVEHHPGEIESSVVIDSLNPNGAPQHSTLLGETSSKSSLDTSVVKDEVNNDVLMVWPSDGIEKASQPPICEASSVVKAPRNCQSAGEALVFHVATGGEMFEHVDPVEDGS
ncbi:hypothetical protein Nepgr_030854 [Nepenthes gracilis]|uniref:Uncharacterized protein n=1 Tax=Nepenthes gracilis TaxID=150966 RepID=A0AAD3Y6Z8_NEPGR|nr:hypothetical protein Nepgr_030854 [Nepenthes gracilis]